MQTNAIHLSLMDYLFDGKLLNGDVILGHSEASIKGYSPAVPEPATWAMLIGGFALVGSCMRRSQKVAVSFA
ncbi:MAG: PEP-CTERM sorting domain-containing protein [Sphingobium sp.]|nr:PEP-CTERM sorting domain-containing protein [Sphingobium sp.]